MKYNRIGELRGLDGMPERVPGWTASSRTGALKVLRAKRVVTGSGHYGAITIWKPRGQPYRAEFSRFRIVQCSGGFVTQADLKRWLAKWWPRMDMEYIQ